MKLLLINLYSSETMARYLLSSYVLKAYLSKAFESNAEFKLDVLNFDTASDVEKICVEISNRTTDYVGYSCYAWNIEKVLCVIERLKEKLVFLHILGGPEISVDRISSFSNPAIADYYVIGEGEKVLENLLLYLENKSKSSETRVPNGVAYFDGNKIVYRENAERIINLDEIPSAYLTGALDESLYVRQQAFLETQRGCRFKCKYCAYHKNLSSTSFYSISRVYAELDYLIIEKQVLALRIFDAVFTSNLQRAKEIAQHLLTLKKKGILLPWIYWEFTCDTVDEEIISLISSLKERESILNTNDCPALDRPQLYSDLLSGYTVINGVGIQSFCGQALKAVGRIGVSRENLKSFMNMCKKHNIVLKIDLILGLPLETFNSYFEGLELFLPFFEDTDHILNIHRLQILPGSQLVDLCEEYGMLYSKTAPHYVFSTRVFPKQELDYASKLSAVLFRTLNSPLRSIFFETKKRSEGSFYDLIRYIFDAIVATERFRNDPLMQNEIMDDGYWNKDIFKDIPSAWLSDLLKAR